MSGSGAGDEQRPRNDSAQRAGGTSVAAEEGQESSPVCGSRKIQSQLSCSMQRYSLGAATVPARPQRRWNPLVALRVVTAPCLEGERTDLGSPVVRETVSNLYHNRAASEQTDIV